MDAKAWDERYSAGELVWGAEPNRFVRAQCEWLPVGRAIDLACGEGRNALWLARIGWRAIGVDFSPVAVERARELTAHEEPDVADRLSWQVGDVRVEAPTPGGYDLALISYLHLPPDETNPVIRNAGHAVAPGGHLLVIGHDRRNLREGVSGPQDEERLYDADAIRDVLADVPELIIEIAEVVERDTPDGIALDTLVRARRPAPDETSGHPTPGQPGR